MPWRVGFDLESPTRIAESLAVHGDRYLRRVYSATEIEQCSRPPAAGRDRDVNPRLLAGRFAAKEAALKAIGVGAAAVSWRDVEVVSGCCRNPSLELKGEIDRIARAAGIGQLSLGLSYERGVAAAIVLAFVFAD
jgi:holo-[acyl-carrier protein] synthase